jgi:predicted helicase
MRKNLLNTFDKIYILDLHGNAKKKETAPDGSKDENVFDIQQGVSINIFVKTRKKNKNSIATVYHADLYGIRAEKYSFLLNNNLQTVRWQQLKIENDIFFFVPKDFGLKEEYEKGFKIDELLPVNTSGVKTHDDANLVSFNPFPKNNQLYAYRPFDNRYINYDLKKVKRHRNEVMQHFLIGNNIGLITCRQQSTFDFQHVFLSNVISDMCAVSLQTKETTYVFPLYLYIKNGIADSDKRPYHKHHNLNTTIINELSHQLDMQFTEEKEETENTFAPIDVLDYIYAILHSPTYRKRYKEFLKIDFPRVPYPQSSEQFWQLVSLGAKLRRLHLLDNVVPKDDIATFPMQGSNEVEKLQYSGDRVYINNTQYFDHVPPEAWNFYIGGYQPAQKWLKDRKGRTLDFDDVNHYRKIIRVLKETGEVMREIDAE